MEKEKSSGMKIQLEASPIKRPVLPGDSEARKNIPMMRGLLDYFPDALAAVAQLSVYGNEKHNPGEPLHWSKGKSNDHADCVVRHLMERGRWDYSFGPDKGVRHSTAAAWRALANLQIEIEESHKIIDGDIFGPSMRTQFKGEQIRKAQADILNREYNDSHGQDVSTCDCAACCSPATPEPTNQKNWKPGRGD